MLAFVIAVVCKARCITVCTAWEELSSLNGTVAATEVAHSMTSAAIAIAWTSGGREEHGGVAVHVARSRLRRSRYRSRNLRGEGLSSLYCFILEMSMPFESAS